MRYLIFSIALIATLGCGDSDSSNNSSTIESFDRKSMLQSWADNHIIPAVSKVAQDAQLLEEAIVVFSATPSIERLTDCRTALLETMTSWQRAAMYNIGKAESLDLQRRINTFPTNTAKITAAINGETYNLQLISAVDQQGLPAIDYLLHGVGESDQEIMQILQSPNATQYLRTATSIIKTLLQEVVSDWEDGYTDVFVDASGNGATGSVDRLVNDYIEYYERRLRAGKLGIPAGVFSDQSLPTHVESQYRPEWSKVLLLESLSATVDFFNGISEVDGSNQVSLADYLNYLDQLRGSESLSAAINAQFDKARVAIEALEPNLQDQITNDNIQTLEAYNELQRVVPLLKIDMVQSMGVNIDFVDTDGD